MRVYLILITFFSACNEGSNNEIIFKDTASADSFKNQSLQNKTCDSASIMLIFSDNTGANFVNDGILVIPEKNVEIDLKGLINEPKLTYPIGNNGTICLAKEMLLNKYSIKRSDSLFAYIYKKNVGYSNGFSISLQKDRIIVPIKIEIKD